MFLFCLSCFSLVFLVLVFPYPPLPPHPSLVSLHLRILNIFSWFTLAGRRLDLHSGLKVFNMILVLFPQAFTLVFSCSLPPCSFPHLCFLFPLFLFFFVLFSGLAMRDVYSSSYSCLKPSPCGVCKGLGV
ncbi:hypothetical protein U1Q18_052651 [Sarracenia purpurea var. burkii]